MSITFSACNPPNWVECEIQFLGSRGILRRSRCCVTLHAVGLWEGARTIMPHTQGVAGEGAVKHLARQHGGEVRADAADALQVCVDQEKPAIPRSEFRGLFKTYREVGKCLEFDRLDPEKTPQDKKTGNWLVDCGGNLVLFGPEERPLAAYRLRKRQRVKREPRGFLSDRTAIDLV